MIKDIMNDEKYKDLVSLQIKNTIKYLLDKNIEFAITANLNSIRFEPALPKVIYTKLSDLSLFILSNYTYSSIQANDTHVSFEAGFGKENFGSRLYIPYYAIFQIIVHESILFINCMATSEKFTKNQVQKSKNIFMTNKHNKKFNNSTKIIY